MTLQVTVDGPDGKPRRQRHGVTWPDTPEGWDAAERERRILVGREAAGDLQVVSEMTVEAFLEGWIERKRYDVASGLLRQNTLDSYAVELRSKVIPQLGQMLLTDLRADHLRRLYGRLLESGGRKGKPLAPKTVRAVGVIVRRALREGVQDGILKDSPAEHVRLPKAGRAPTPETWEPSETQRFLDGASEPLRSMAFVVATTGMRRSEILGLRWSRVDLEEKALVVNATVVPSSGGDMFAEMTKTSSSRRKVALDDATVVVLRSHRVRQGEARLAAGEVWDGSLGLVFTNEIGQTFGPDRLTRLFQRECGRLGLSPIGIHGLRHSLATLALAEGVPVKVVSERLGHASVMTTWDMYSHVSEEQDREAAVSLASLIVGSG